MRAKRELLSRLAARIPHSLRSLPPSQAKGAIYFDAGIIVTSLILSGLLYLAAPGIAHAGEEHSVARQWNEELLEAIRRDFARPTVHARNLYHVSAAMWDAWAAFDLKADAVFHHEYLASSDIEADRHEAISYAAYRLLRHRFATSPGNDPEDPDNPENTLNQLRQRMITLDYDPDFNQSTGDTPAALGVRIANTIIQHGLNDGANEANGYANQFYEPVNPPLDLDEPGNPDMPYPNQWQPLRISGGFVDQSGNQIGQARSFLGAEWGAVTPFALGEDDLEIHPANTGDWYHWVYLDPGLPPQLGGAGDEQFKASFARVIEFSSYLDPDDGEAMDISPDSLGNNSLGTNDGDGYEINPHTGDPYDQQIVPSGDYYRVIAEFWADGPASETPPGHWFTLLNEKVNDDPALERRIGGTGPEVGPLEWEVKAYLALGGAVHDAAAAAWGVKGYHNFVRPITAIRYMAEKGQSSDPQADAYDPEGLPLIPDLIELITDESASAGGRHEHLSDYVGEIAIRAWRGHDAETDPAGAGWIRAREWWPYQQDNFITPPFAGYVSGHSTFSRAAAEVLSLLTGDEFFPGGLANHCVGEGELDFEFGPSQELCLEWARYYDASDQSAVSRIYGGIHPDIDDIPGRIMGHTVGIQAWNLAERYFIGGMRPIFQDEFSAQQ